MDISNVDIESVLSGLSEQEREATLQILSELQNNGSSNMLNTLYNCDYEEIPVSIEQFITDKRYAGEFTSGGKNVYPYWRKQLSEIFDKGNTYSEVALTGSIGIGKSTIAVLGLAYVLYKLMCLKDPHDFYDINKGGYIYIVFFNATLALSQGVAYTKLQGLLQMSPWFMERGKVVGTKNLEYVPNKPIRFTVGSQMEHSLGKDIFAGLLDEINFVKGADVHMEQSKIMKTYNCLYGNNKVVTSNGNYDIADLCDDSVDVYTIDKKGSISVSDDRFVKNTKMSTDCIDIELEDGTVVSVTPEHKIMLADGTYKEAQYLTDNDILMEKIDESNVFDISIWEQFDIKSYKWLNKYLQFMKNVYNRDTSGLDYVEKHHVLPKSFMLNNFCVNLTYREHFIAHRILCRCFNGEYGQKMCFAFYRMVHGKHNVKINNRTYQCIKTDVYKALAVKFKGRVIPDSVKLKMSKNHADFKGKNHPLYNKKGVDSPNYGRVYIHKGSDVRKVKKSQLDNFLLNGYELGVSDEYIERNRQSKIGNVCVNKDGKNIFVKMEDLDLYLSDGYDIGMITDRNGEKSSTYNKVVVNRSGNIHFINKEDLDLYLFDGFKMGTGLSSHNKDKVCVNKDGKNKFVSEDNLYYYLDSGYSIGQHKKENNFVLGKMLISNIHTGESKYVDKDYVFDDNWVVGMLNTNSRYLYKYNDLEFNSKIQIVRYIQKMYNCKFSITSLNKICDGVAVKGYEFLVGRIQRVEKGDICEN